MNPFRPRSRSLFSNLCSLAALVVSPSIASAGDGYWLQEAPVFYDISDKPCQPAGNACIGGWKKFYPESGGELQVYDAGVDHTTFGKRIPDRPLQPHWSKIKAWWQAPPAALRPGQKITFQYGVQVMTPGWANFDSKAWVYRMSGPGGEQDQLGLVGVSDATAGVTRTTKLHTVPDGFGAKSGADVRDSRLRYQMGGSNGGVSGGKVVFSYRWVPDGHGQAVPESMFAPKPVAVAAAPQPAPSPTGVAGGAPVNQPNQPIGTNPRETAGTGGSPGSQSPTGPRDGARPGPVRNLALGRTATQSSIYLGTGVNQGPQHAVDGKTGGRDPHDLVHTNYENSPWWQVDLGGTAAIDRVRLFNRQNPGVKANLKLVVQVSDDARTWRGVYTHDETVWKTLDIPVGGLARFVRVALTNHDAVQLYEVEVWGRMP